MAGCFCFANPSGFLFGPSQKGTICSSIDTSSFVNICDIENLTNFATKKKEKLVEFTLGKKFPKIPILLF
jgi:hypothetical protein